MRNRALLDKANNERRSDKKREERTGSGRLMGKKINITELIIKCTAKEEEDREAKKMIG